MKKMNPGMMAIMAKRKDMPEKKEMAMKKGGMPKMSAGGKMPMKDGKPAFLNDGKGMKHGGMAMKKPVKKMAKGGGIEIKGKTKGTMIGMKKGGKACK